ncbi:MAG: DUF4383 domain-containing protein [Actinomycetota bacterium]|jgi:hypothetical protein|nr:DUF4383 domain-containing protein [Actinomycetota bacterium]
MAADNQPHTFRRTYTPEPSGRGSKSARTRPAPISTGSSGRSVNQYLALVVGLAFVAGGVIGFYITGFDDFFNRDTNQFLLGLEINPAHNVVHLVLGLLGLALWWTHAGARTYGAILFVGYGAAFVYGLFAVDNADINVLSMNTADNWFHLGSALTGLVIAVLPARRR